MVKFIDVIEFFFDFMAIVFLWDDFCGGDLILFGEMVVCYC